MRMKIGCPGLTPRAAVSTFDSRAYNAGMKRFMRVAVLCPMRHKTRAAGVCARMVRHSRHRHTLLVLLVLAIGHGRDGDMRLHRFPIGIQFRTGRVRGAVASLIDCFRIMDTSAFPAGSILLRVAYIQFFPCGAEPRVICFHHEHILSANKSARRTPHDVRPACSVIRQRSRRPGCIRYGRASSFPEILPA